MRGRREELVVFVVRVLRFDPSRVTSILKVHSSAYVTQVGQLSVLIRRLHQRSSLLQRQLVLVLLRVRRHRG